MKTGRIGIRRQEKTDRKWYKKRTGEADRIWYKKRTGNRPESACFAFVLSETDLFSDPFNVLSAFLFLFFSGTAFQAFRECLLRFFQISFGMAGA